eukprot:UN00089
MTLPTTRNVHNEIPSYELAPNRGSIRQKLEELKQFSSPSRTFYDIDTLFLLYSSIIRQYNVAYDNINLYKKKISASLKPENQNSIITLSVQEISQVISNMNDVQTKLKDWIDTVSNKTVEIQLPAVVEHKSESKSNPSTMLSRQTTAPIGQISKMRTMSACAVDGNKMFYRNPLRSQYQSKAPSLRLSPNKYKKRKKRKKILFAQSDRSDVRKIKTYKKI